MTLNELYEQLKSMLENEPGRGNLLAEVKIIKKGFGTEYLTIREISHVDTHDARIAADG